MTLVAKLLQRFLLTMPSEAAKKVRTCEMKGCSVVESLFQSWLQGQFVLQWSRRKLRPSCAPPDVVVLNGEEDETMVIHLEKWLSSKVACSFGSLLVQDHTTR